jgi:hypothetical protein
LTTQPAAAANKVPVNLRVVTWKGKILFDKTVRTGTAKIKPNAACLGGEPGAARTVSGPTALGLLYQGSLRYKALRPLKLSDGDFGFGICGIAATAASGDEWWVLWRNSKVTSTGAELTKVKRGDSILFYLAKTWKEETPDSLSLLAPKTKIRKGGKLKVRVVKYTTAGKRSPVAGAKVSGASGAPTNARGYTTLTIARKTRLVARQSGLIPSNRVQVTIKKKKK